MLSRRGLITGLVSFVAAPAIVRAANLMPVKVMEAAESLYGRGPAVDAVPVLTIENIIRAKRMLREAGELYGNFGYMPISPAWCEALLHNS